MIIAPEIAYAFQVIGFVAVCYCVVMAIKAFYAFFVLKGK